MIKTIKRHFFTTVLSLFLIGVSGCTSLHDGEGIEHEPGEPRIKHKH